MVKLDPNRVFIGLLNFCSILTRSIMNSEKTNFLSQPVVKNIFVYRNGDPFYEAHRLVVNQKRVSNFDTFLREVTGGLQAPFGAVRNIYTPRMGHRVDSLEHLQSGKQYVAAGREKFKKLDYSQIGTKKKRMLQANFIQVKPVPQRRIIASARFLKPIKNPCTIFVVANGDVLNPALRVLIPQRILSQYDRVLEMITEKMALRILGGVRSLYTFDGKHVNDGKDLENGQFYVAVGRDKLKRLPYNDLLFTKRNKRITSKSSTLPPIYRYEKRNGNVCSSQHSTSMVACSEPAQSSTCDEDRVASIVRKVSQQRLMILRNKRSCINLSLAPQDNDGEQQAEADSPGENGDTSPWRHLPTGEKTTKEDNSSSTDEDLEGTDYNEESRGVKKAAEEQGDNEDNKVSPRCRKETSDPTEENQQTVDQVEETSDPVEEDQGSVGQIWKALEHVEEKQESVEQGEEVPDPVKENQDTVDQEKKVLDPVKENQDSVDQEKDVPDPVKENQDSVDQDVNVPDPVENNQESVDQEGEDPEPVEKNQESKDQEGEDTDSLEKNQESVDQVEEVPEPVEKNQEYVDQEGENPEPVEKNQESVDQEGEDPEPVEKNQESVDQVEEVPEPVEKNQEYVDQEWENQEPVEKNQESVDQEGEDPEHVEKNQEYVDQVKEVPEPVEKNQESIDQVQEVSEPVEENEESVDQVEKAGNPEGMKDGEKDGE